MEGLVDMGGLAFFKVGNNYFQLRHILSIRKTKAPSKGKDGIKRGWVVAVSKESLGCDESSKYQNIWCSTDEIRNLLGYIGHDIQKSQEEAE